MPKYNVNYSYFIKEIGGTEIYADDVESLRTEVEQHVENLFADSGDDVKDIQIEMYEIVNG